MKSISFRLLNYLKQIADCETKKELKELYIKAVDYCELTFTEYDKITYSMDAQKKN